MSTSREKTMVKYLSIFFATFFIIMGFTGYGSAQLKIGISSVNIAFTPLYVTRDKGFFSEEGLGDVELLLFASGREPLQALIAKNIQVVAGGSESVVTAIDAGVKVKIFWSQSNIMPYKLYANPNIKTVKDLKGKKVAVSKIGSTSDFLVRHVVRNFGLDPWKDITVLQVGSTPARFSALSAGSVDATLLWFPVDEIAEEKGFRMLVDVKDIFPEWQYELFASTDDWLKKNRDIALKFVRAYRKGVSYTKQNQDEAIGIMQKFLKGIDKTTAIKGYEYYKKSWLEDGRFAENGLRIMIDQLVEQKEIKRKYEPNEIIDYSFINEFSK